MDWPGILLLTLNSKLSTLSEGGFPVDLSEYTQYQETKLHEKPGFAYETYLCTIPRDFDRVALHWHDQMEVVYIKKGRGTVSVNLRGYPVEAGCIVPVLPGELHAIEGDPDAPMEYENIIFSLSILDSTETDDWCRRHVIHALRRGTLRFPRPICPGTDFHAEASAALDGADRACADREDGYALVVKSRLFLFLHALYRFRAREAPDQEPGETQHLKDVISYVKGHYGERIAIADAASVCGYSASHFMRIFRRETGQTFVDFLTDYRLSAAVYYLKETGDEVSAIAERCGFDNISYFIRRFHGKYGVSPGKYRKERARE